MNDIKHVKNVLNPIITITENSGITSPDINFYKVIIFFITILQIFCRYIFFILYKYNNFVLLQSKFVDDFQFDNIFQHGQKLSKEFHQSNLTRSQTDSNITYIREECTEVPGSLNHITKDGDVDFLVVLKV